MAEFTTTAPPPPEVKKRGKYEEHEDTLSILPGFEFEGISSFWRKNTSFIEATELANILRAFRKVAGHIGQNVGRIEWAGMSHAGEEAIVLDPGIVWGHYPVPFRRIDYLVGIVTHEALHRTEWADLVWRKIEEASKDMGLIHKIILHKIVYTGEDIYVDCISDKSILGLYTRAARSMAMEEARLLLKSKTVTVEELIYLWWVSVWKKFAETEIPVEYREPLSILQVLTERLKKVYGEKKSVTDRCDERYRLYWETWEAIKGLISSWQIMDRSLLWCAPTEGELSPKKPPPKSVLSPAEAQEVETNLAYDSTDITPIIRSIVGDDVDIVPTSRWDFNMPAHPVVDRHLASRLRLIFENYADREILPSRGLLSGKVDRRKLYRAPINGRCFFEKMSLPKLDWNICLLMDASGSMAGPKWRMVENVIGTIHRAFGGFQNRLQAYAYFEIEGVCLISKLTKGDNLLSIPPSGKTASGQAIIAAAYFLPRKGEGRKFIVHVTDGESNLGCDVQYGIDYCKRKNIHLVTLGCGYKNRETMLKQYGNKSIQFLDHFDQLPAAMEKLLRWIMVYGVRK